MRRFLSVFLGIALMASFALLAGCGEESDTPTSESSVVEPVETIELSYATPVPEQHVFGQTADAWFSMLEEETNGQVEITPYWGGSLVAIPDCVTEAVAGVADISHIEPGATASGFPLYKGSFGFYYGIEEVADLVTVYHGLMQTVPELDAEFSDILKPVGRITGVMYHLLSKEPIRTLDDFKGKIIRAPASLSGIFQALGAEAINLPMGDVYTALSKSTIDGALIAMEALESWKFYEAAQYVTYLYLASPPGSQIVLNYDVYDGLPSDVQKVFDDNVDWFENKLAELMDAADASGKALGDENGVEFIEFSEADQAEFDAIVQNFLKGEAAKLDDQGLPGTKLLEEIQRLTAEL